ncbi:MAG: S8 family serine peptidase [Chloroflexota bacterium]
MGFTQRPLLTRALRRALALLSGALILAVAVAPAANATAPVIGASTRAACDAPTRPDEVRCFAMLRTDVSRSSRPIARMQAVSPSVTLTGPWYPADLQAAYGLTSAALSSGAGRTVAIVDAYDDPTAEEDLATYRSSQGLPPCTTANGCFRKVDQNGGTNYPAADAGWSVEIALDLDMVSAICPNCSILLVEANSANIADLGTAVNRAVAMGAKYVSNSYGTGAEYPSETTWDTLYYKHLGVVLTASTGDAGYGVSYPAASPYVVAVGGTSLTKVNGVWTESAWSGAGSGCSVYEPKPAWQSDTGCAKRMLADVSAEADYLTPVAIYNGGNWDLSAARAPRRR